VLGERGQRTYGRGTSAIRALISFPLHRGFENDRGGGGVCEMLKATAPTSKMATATSADQMRAESVSLDKDTLLNDSMWRPASPRPSSVDSRSTRSSVVKDVQSAFRLRSD
jgi:hypothetical protein